MPLEYKRDATDNLNDTSTQGYSPRTTSESLKRSLALYIGVSVAIGIVICILILICINRKRLCCGRNGRRLSNRPLFIRGFSTTSQRGVIDSTAEFEMINTSGTHSVSSEDGKDLSRNAPKKPERRRTRTSSSNVQYENVALGQRNAGFVIRKSHSTDLEIPYMDNTLGSHISEKDEEADDVFI